MTVAELIAELQNMPQNAEVIVAARSGGFSVYNHVRQISSNETYESNRDELIVWVEGLSCSF